MKEDEEEKANQKVLARLKILGNEYENYYMNQMHLGPSTENPSRPVSSNLLEEAIGINFIIMPQDI